jgi:hypothetical protein
MQRHLIADIVIFGSLHRHVAVVRLLLEGDGVNGNIEGNG